MKKYKVLKPLIGAPIGTILEHRSSSPHQTAGLYTEKGEVIVLWYHIDKSIEEGFVELIV